MNLDQKILWEIAEELDMGMHCFLHKKTKIPLFVIDIDNPDASEVLEFYEEDLAKIKANQEQYIKIEPMSSDESFRIMENFTETVSNQRIRGSLETALFGRKPFRNFSHQVDSNADVRAAWFKFKKEQSIEWVNERLEDLNETS